MKALSITAILSTLLLSISANASLKVGDTLVLKKDLQSIDGLTLLVNGKEESPFRSINKSACGIDFTDRGYTSHPTYSKGTEFIVKSVEKSLNENKFMFTLYRGLIDIKLQEKNGASEEVVSIGCSTEEYMTQTTARLKTVSKEDVLKLFSNLF